MATGARELTYAVTVVGATLLGLTSTMLGVFLDWPAMTAVVVVVAAVGTLALESNRAVAGLVGGLTALLAGIVAPRAVLAVGRTGSVFSLSLLVAGLVVLVGLGTLSTTAFDSRTDAGPHA